MNLLSKDLQAFLEQFLLLSGQLVDASTEILDRTFTQIEQGVDEYVEPVIVEIEQGLDEIFDPVLEDLIAFENNLEELASPLTQRLNPLLDQQLACIGCRHYHGKTYGESFLVT